MQVGDDGGKPAPWSKVPSEFRDIGVCVVSFICVVVPLL